MLYLVQFGTAALCGFAGYQAFDCFAKARAPNLPTWARATMCACGVLQTTIVLSFIKTAVGL